MDKDNLNLFNSDLSEVVLPSVSSEAEKENQELYSQDISEVILAPKVDVIVVPKDTNINTSNFIFDFSETSAITVMQKEVLKSLVAENGNTEIYLYKKNGLISIGMGDKYYLERVIPLIKKWIFSDSIRIYKNFIPGRQIFEVTGRDFTKLRMNI